MKESAEEENKEAPAGRAFLVSPPTNRTQRRRRLWFWVLRSVERKREEDEEKRLERSRKVWTLNFKQRTTTHILSPNT